MTPLSKSQETVPVFWDPTPFGEKVSQEVGGALIDSSMARDAWIATGRFGAVVLAELLWERMRSDFEGLDLIRSLRTDPLCVKPIVLCSFMSRENLKARLPLLKFKAEHPFVRLPIPPTAVAASLHRGRLLSKGRWHHLQRYTHPVQRIVQLLTHGAGFQSLRDQHPSASPDLIPKIERDADLFERYLQHEVVPPVALAAGRDLLSHIRRFTSTFDDSHWEYAHTAWSLVCKALSATVASAPRP